MRRVVIAVIVAVLSAFGASGLAAEKAAIAFANYADGTTIRYPVPLIRGTLADETLTEVTLTNESSTRPATRRMESPTSISGRRRFFFGRPATNAFL